jgi:biopolymer transport protein ExbD
LKKKKSFLKKQGPPADVALQITSMADIFMILLVFLLKSYSTSLTNLAPTGHIELPVINASNKSAPKETLKIEIGKDAILVDAKPAIKLEAFNFPEIETQNTASSATIRTQLQAQRELRPEPNRDSSLIIMADQKTPFSTLKRVIASASEVGFVDLQLIVVNPE